MEDIMQLCDTVRQTAYDIHVYHGHGHLEKVYENELAHRLRKLGLDVKQQLMRRMTSLLFSFFAFSAFFRG